MAYTFDFDYEGDLFPSHGENNSNVTGGTGEGTTGWGNTLDWALNGATDILNGAIGFGEQLFNIEQRWESIGDVPVGYESVTGGNQTATGNTGGGQPRWDDSLLFGFKKEYVIAGSLAVVGLLIFLKGR